MAAECPRAMMVLAMNIIGDCAAKGYGTRSGCDRQEKAMGHNTPHDLS